MYSKILKQCVRAGFLDMTIFIVQQRNSCQIVCPHRKPKQSDVRLLSLTPNTFFAASDLTGSHKSTSLNYLFCLSSVGSLSLIVGFDIRLPRHKKVTTKSNDIWTDVTRKCNALTVTRYFVKIVTRYRYRYSKK